MRLTLSLLVFLLCFQTHAQDEGGEVLDDVKAEKFSVKLGLVDYHYEEPGLMKIHGRLYEVQGGFRNYFHWGSWAMLYGGRLSVAAGTTTYDGGLAHANGVVTPASNPSSDRIFNFEGLFGTPIFSSAHHELDVFLGPGLWFLMNKIDGAGSYSRDISYIYAPVGMAYTLKLWDCKMNLGAQYDAFIVGVAQSALSELNSKYNDVTSNQSSGNGARFSAGFEYAFSSWSLTADGYYKFWNIGDSDSQYSGGAYWREPHNTTKMLGVNLGARF